MCTHIHTMDHDQWYISSENARIFSMINSIKLTESKSDPESLLLSDSESMSGWFLRLPIFISMSGKWIKYTTMWAFRLIHKLKLRKRMSCVLPSACTWVLNWLWQANCFVMHEVGFVLRSIYLWSWFVFHFCYVLWIFVSMIRFLSHSICLIWIECENPTFGLWDCLFVD